jgi:tRNA-uridine 2-sulfurtransferase
VPREIFGDATQNGRWAGIRLAVEGDRIVDSDADGLERPLAGLTLLEAARVSGEPLVVEAVASALGQVFVADSDPERIAVAMSGGVDSAVALHRAGPGAIGVTLRLWQDPAGPSAERACCSPAAVAAARATCHALGLPHVTLDLREEFRAEVVSPFVDAYRDGDTPNPCTRCNGAFRFDALLEFASRAGARKLWTGHYARIVERDGMRLLARGRDPEKDQSYMLATVRPELLERVAFPLGDQTKEETRAEARAAGLAAAGRRESQEACFLAGGDYRSFLERQGLAPEPGDVVDEHGERLGGHDGYWRYTPGQRRGVGVAAARPLYVVRTDRSANAVVVGPRESLAVRRVEADGALYAPVARADVKLRYRSAAVATEVREAHAGFALDLEQEAYGVATGQVAVLYEEDVVVGAGVVTDVS